MKRLTIAQFDDALPRIDRFLRKAGEIQIIRCGRPIARLLPMHSDVSGDLTKPQVRGSFDSRPEIPARAVFRRLRAHHMGQVRARRGTGALDQG
jgi:hypothetical protein